MTRADRVLAVRVGWQSECAIQPHASHLATTVLRIEPDICPTTLAGCIEFGRKMLRAHLETVRGKGG